MAFTRAQANALLNRTEMRLFDDSRANALRGLDRSELDARITRARASRDRARDLLKRQRGAARTRGVTGPDGVAARTARKEELLVEILERFTSARRDAPAAAKKATRKVARKAATSRTSANPAATGKTAAARKAPAKKAVEKKAVAKKTVAKKTVAKKAVAKKAVAKTAPAKKAVAKKATTSRATKQPGSRNTGADGAAATKKASTSRARTARGRLSPERALEQTRKLLEAKQERDRTPQPWQALDPSVGHVPQPGYQSEEAASKAKDLHDGEARVPSIHGSISTRDRINQGKRDHRGDN